MGGSLFRGTNETSCMYVIRDLSCRRIRSSILIQSSIQPDRFAALSGPAMFRRRGSYRRLSVTTAVASNVNANDAYRENPRADRSRYASEISSSLPLQILVYYNGLFSAAYFVLMGGLIIEKVRVGTI